MKSLIPIAIAILSVGCGGKDKSTTKTTPPEIKKETLPQIPDKVTKEFVMDLWSQPNNETNLNRLIEKIVPKSGVWKTKREMSLNENEMINSIEGTLTTKFVNRRFVVWNYNNNNVTVFAALTYNFNTEKYYWWEFGNESPNGEFYTSYEGRIIDDNAIEWNSTDNSDGLSFKIKHFIRSANTIEMMLEASKNNKPLGVAKDNMVWSKELPKK